MKKDSIYYDGPIEISNRTEEELEKDLAEEKERMRTQEWSEEYEGI